MFRNKALLGTDCLAANGDAYTWPGYRSDLDYDTKSIAVLEHWPGNMLSGCSRQVRIRGLSI